ncbi:uncharacterized protein UMAG_10959 [Mycosarcoma maydis]|uniref:Uncharacterized protein n=1 Tax=Mycosarcoma maydis TaxID=5270 RepID=A0A0D1CFN8_MYCMD|nr:uncharacterized protein UMAG_10959 [Ustilago maydis 521]KIS71822.1 hypothetical protein UMAG_10959 [Ustilago maydis 521]|eukprot:XP_011386708.1 hypothetical protein UMAG_10959 [Ustilago maydis 521]
MQTLLEYTLSYEGQHVITPLAILVECVSTLCCVTHHLDPSANKMKLGQQMRIRINILIANQDWDALYIFAKMIDGQTSVRRGAHGLGAAHLETDEATNKIGQVMEPFALNRHLLNTLPILYDHLRWNADHVLDPSSGSHADTLLRSIVMQSISPQLHIEYFSEHDDQLSVTVSDLFVQGVNKCTMHSDVKQYKVLIATLASMGWGQC